MMRSTDEFIQVKIAHGQFSCVKRSQVVGYCRYPCHRGYVTKNVMKAHKCTKQNCRYFSKLNENGRPCKKNQKNF